MRTRSLPLEEITHRIVLLRGHKVLLDADLAALYDVTTKRLNEQVKRNLERFPADFMFQLTSEEYDSLRSQTATSNIVAGRGGRRYLPYAFAEHGAVMAASILNSERAIGVSVYVVRAFVQLRELIVSHKELMLRLDELESRTDLVTLKQETFEQEAGLQLKQIIDTLRELMTAPPTPKKRPIGFVTPEEPAAPRR